MAEVIEAWAKPKDGLALGIELRDTGELVGHAGCSWGWDPHCPNAWVVVAPARQRTGVGSGVLVLLLAHLFENTVAHNVSGWVAGWNEPGLAFALQNGFTESGRTPRGGLRDGAWFDKVLLDRLKPEWLAAKEGTRGA